MPSTYDDTTVDISSKLLGLWTTPVELDIQHLRKYFETPLEQDWKIPLSHSQWQKLLFKRDGFPLENCFDEDLQSLFRPSEDEMADRIWYMFRDAIMNGPLDPTGTEESLHQFWDTNIRTILVRCLSADSIRNSRNQGTTEDAQEAFLPRLGILLRCVCVFRGEDKRQSFTGMHPQLELKQKTRWVYDPAPYILVLYPGFVTIAAIHRQEDQTLGVWDIAKADLSPRRERIRSLSRMIKLCGILRSLHQVIGDGKDADMSFETCEGDKRIEFGRSYVHKVYGLGGHDEDHTKERITHLQAVYTFLALKHVPNVDRLRKAEILHPRRGSYVDLEPRGINPNSMSLLDVRNAVVCVLEALQVMHADPAIFHRDIRWPNIMQSREDASKWFLTGKILPLSRPKQQNV
ncbi:hypothetical protein BDN72DRAFT_896808 [Pluteus cervinus]|uniref:Uncharacterized protein n=1 Tax=Pluteus cervinus TaxID=181527 RepID=A0ACD3AXD3_9AGAR|nr:hypothetical protein BDN72DRAFT_896808 [Pluteus cervinus]